MREALQAAFSRNLIPPAFEPVVINAGSALEPVHRVAIGGHRRGMNLIRHVPAEPRVLSLVDDPHPSLSQRLQNPIV